MAESLKFETHLGDCREVLAEMPENSVDAVVCDPPYGLEFMGKEWDRLQGYTTDIKFKGFVLPRQRKRNIKCPDCEKWIYDHPSRNCVCGGVKRFQSRSMQEWHYQWAVEVFRVLKPGGHLLAFGGTRTSHRLTCAIEDAGFEIRDCIMWIYGSGFPKSLDIGKAIDKVGGDVFAWQEFSKAYSKAVTLSDMSHSDIDRALGIKSSSCYWARTDYRGGMPPRHHWEKVCKILTLSKEFEHLYNEAERVVVAVGKPKGKSRGVYGDFAEDYYNYTAPATPEAKKWDGWGTALKPSHEIIVVARKPLEGTVAQNILKHGTGGINVDGCRVGTSGRPDRGCRTTPSRSILGANSGMAAGETRRGRWPPNLVFSHLEDCRLIGTRRAKGYTINRWEDGAKPFGGGAGHPFESEQMPDEDVPVYDCHPDCPVRLLDEDSGSASRFFPCFKYEPKASRSEREAGCEHLPKKLSGGCTDRETGGARNHHPCVKPVKLMQWLIRLVCNRGGVVLDPFAGSFTTGIAAYEEGCSCILIEKEPDYFEIGKARLAHARRQRRLF